MMKETGYPGMKVLSFGFDGNPENEHKASNHENNVYAYTGTHDNAPIREMIEDFEGGKLENFRLEMKKETARLGLNFTIDEKDGTESVCALCENLLEQLFPSKADVAIAPLQDVLGFGKGSRVNSPSTVSGNWTFRFQTTDFTKNAAKKLRALIKKYQR